MLGALPDAAHQLWCHAGVIFLALLALPTTKQPLMVRTAQIGITNGNTVDGRDHAGATATSFRSGITTVTGQSLGGDCAGHNCHMRYATMWHVTSCAPLLAVAETQVLAGMWQGGPFQ